MAGMTVVSVQVPTGFVVARDSIENLYRSGVPGLRRARFRDGTLHTLFENVSIGSYERVVIEEKYILKA